MGTNFYFFTDNKCAISNYFVDDYELTDSPRLGYKIHIAKTSFGWLPLFEKHGSISSVKDIKNIFSSGKFEIHDEYGVPYTWNEFCERVLKFNGGVKGVVPQTRKDISLGGSFQFEYVPISHFEYDNGKFADSYLKDDDGYEFSIKPFS